MYATCPTDRLNSINQTFYNFPILQMNQPFLDALKEFDNKLDTQVNNWNLISETFFGKQSKSECCHTETTTYQLKDVCSCCLKRCELEK